MLLRTVFGQVGVGIVRGQLAGLRLVGLCVVWVVVRRCRMRAVVGWRPAAEVLDGTRHTHVPSLPGQTICGQLRPPRNLMGDDTVHIRPARIDPDGRGQADPQARQRRGAEAARQQHLDCRAEAPGGRLHRDVVTIRPPA